MSKDFFSANKEILQKQYPGLFEELSLDDSSLPEDDIKIEAALSGDPTLSIKGISIHSRHDPARESMRLAQTISAENGQIVVLGFGLGYAAQAAAELGRHVIIVEKYRNLILKALELRDLSDFLLKSKLIFVIGGSGDAVSSALDLFSKDEKKNISVIRNKALTALDEDWYRNIDDKIRTWSMKDEVNKATLKRFGKRWVRNFIRNITTIRDTPGISRLEGLAAVSENKVLPIFLAAAGPGLDKIKPYLKDIYSRCIIIAVDTSLRFFIKNGIQPDFVVVVDPQFWNSRHLDRCICGAPIQTALITESAVYPPVLNLPFKNKFLCGSFFPLGTFIEKRVDPKGKLAAGGSVATTAWDFARSLGGREIWIAGLDLAYPGFKTHFRGARFEEKSNSESSRFSPVEKWVMRALRDGIPFLAPSASGGQVLTDRRLSLYAAWFENQFRLHGHVQNFSFSHDGLAITGLQNADIEKLLALPECRREIDNRIHTVYGKIKTDFYPPEKIEKRQEDFNNAVNVFTEGLKDIKDAALKGAEIAQQALKVKLNLAQQNEVLKKLDKITKLITESEVKEAAGFLFPKPEGDVHEGDLFLTYLKTTLKFFNGIAESASLTML